MREWIPQQPHHPPTPAIADHGNEFLDFSAHSLQFFRSILGLGVYTFESLLRGKLDPGPKALSILADEHLISGYENYKLKRWAVVYPTLSILMTVGLFAAGGWKAVVFLLASQLFATGFLHPHNFGIILSNSHFHGSSTYQPSSSLYGWANWLYFNFGLHLEHHDLMGIPWSRLGRLREIAPEFYDDLIITKSYRSLAMKFVMGSPQSLEAQFTRQDEVNKERLESSAADNTTHDEKFNEQQSEQVPMMN